MKALKIVGATLGGLIAIYVAVGYVLPPVFGLERSIVINAPVEVVWDLVNNLPNQDQWEPWRQQDATMKRTFSGPESGVGAKLQWTSQNSGSGRMTIVESVPLERVVSELEFTGHGEARATIALEPTEGGVSVVWDFEAAAPDLRERYFGLFIEPLLGPQYELGLKTLKELAERQAAASARTP